MLTSILSSVIPTILFSVSPALASPSARRFDSLVVFGDSHSDTGNAYAWTNGSWPSDPAYYQHHFSNGPTWPEYIPPLIGVKQVLNFAYSSATVNNSIVTGLGGNNLDTPMPSVTDQVATFLNSTGPVPSRSVVVIFIGVNDAFYGGLNVDVNALTKSVVNNVKLLVARGFKSFVLSTRPANVFIPAFGGADPTAAPALNAYAANWNGNLTQAIAASHLPRNFSVKLWDWYAMVEEARKVAVKRGVDVDTPCLVWTPVRTVCEDPEKHFFWDIFHMSTAVHKTVAGSIARAIAEV